MNDIDNQQDKKPHLWRKGQSGNYKGRPKKPKPLEKTLNKELTQQLFREANGDPYEYLKLCLKHGNELGLDMADGFKLAKELMPYEKPKKASIETKIDHIKQVEFRMVLPDTYDALQQVYKVKPQIIDALKEETLNEIIDGKKDLIEVVNEIKPENKE